MNNDQFLIEGSFAEDAKDICSNIKDANIRKRAMANVFASLIAKKYFSEIDVDNISSICKIPEILENYDISDIYTKGNNYIDVRLCFGDKDLFVPKKHFELGVKPIAYMFIKVDKELSNGQVIGFSLPEDIDTTITYGDYYKVEEENIISFYDVESGLGTIDDRELSANFEELILDYFDGKIPLNTEILENLIFSKEARNYTKSVSKTKHLINEINFDSFKNQPDSTDVANGNQTIDILGNNSLSDDLAELNPSLENNEIFTLDEVQDLSDSQDIISDLEELDEVVNLETFGEEENFSLAADDTVSEDFTQSSLDITEELPSSEDKQEFEYDAVADSANEEILQNNDDVSEIADLTSNVDESALPESAELIDSNNSPEKLENNNPVDEEFANVSEFDYSTEITPSLNTIENTISDNQIAEDNELTEQMLETTDLKAQANAQSTSDNRIESLYGNEDEQQASINLGKTKKKSPLLAIGLLIALLGTLGYYGYKKYMSPLPEDNTVVNNSFESPVQEEKKTKQEEPMPIESVEKQLPQKTNEGNAVSIPAIEKNLDASIIVSNLSINWEVPASYTSNSTAKRYFIKMGKIIQLKLKAELLLLSRPPITNKIMLELEFNKNSQRFSIKEITMSSGEKKVDDVIRKTVQNVLDLNLNTNTSIFENLQGNPILVIKL